MANLLDKIYFQGPLSTIAPESEFVVGVFLDVKNSINAFDLEIVYPKDKLEFLNFDNTNSIVNIWQPTPSILSNGNIRLTGGIVKAFNGEEGLIINLAFKVLDAGQAKFSFAKNNLYLANGKGTEIKVAAPALSFSVSESGKVIHAPIIPFKSTPENILIEQKLETFKSDIFWKQTFIPTLIFSIIFIILVFYKIKVYNKTKRKQ